MSSCDSAPSRPSFTPVSTSLPVSGLLQRYRPGALLTTLTSNKQTILPSSASLSFSLDTTGFCFYVLPGSSFNHCASTTTENGRAELDPCKACQLQHLPERPWPNTLHNAPKQGRGGQAKPLSIPEPRQTTTKCMCSTTEASQPREASTGRLCSDILLKRPRLPEPPTRPWRRCTIPMTVEAPLP